MTTSIPLDPAREPIDVVRIRLSRDAGATAIVSEFRLANRVLAAWAAQASGECGVDYEVTFFDGLRLAGRHALLRKGKAHASLSRVVRRLFKQRAAGPASYLVDG
jgi:hypothetical protein